MRASSSCPTMISSIAVRYSNEKCIGMSCSSGDRAGVVSEDSKENRIENDSTSMRNKFDSNEVLHRNEANYSANVVEEETSIDRITKKMSRTSLSSSKINESLRALSTANFNISIDSKTENNFENVPIADHYLSATLREKCLDKDGEEVQFLANEPSERVRLIAEGNEGMGNSQSATLNSELEWSISDSAFYEYLSCERSSLKPTLIRTSEADFVNINDSVSDSVLLALPSQKEDEPEVTLETDEAIRDSTYVKESILWNEVDSNNLKSEDLATDENASAAASIIASAAISATNIKEASGGKRADVLVNSDVPVGVDGDSQLLFRHQDADIQFKEEELESCSFDRSGDLFEISHSSSVASDSPYEVRIKRARQRCSIKSPLSPTCHSPLTKVVKLSSPCSTTDVISPLALQRTSSPYSVKNISSSEADGNKGDLSTPLKRGGIIRLKSSQGVRDSNGDERIFEFMIDDVCRSESRWLNFIEEVSSWNDVGVGVCLGKRNSMHGVTVVAVALCSRNGNPAFIPFDDSSVYGDIDEEADFPSCTPADSIGIEERVRLFESVLASTHRKIFFDLMATMRALNPPTFSSDLVVNRLSNCICIKTLSFLAHFRTSDSEHPLSFQELIARVPSVRALVLKKSSSGRVAASIYAFVNIRLYEWLLPLATRLSSEKSVSLELESTELLARLEATGIAFDRQAGHDLLQRTKSEMSSLEAEGRRLASMPFNFDSPSEIANVLFVRMGIQPVSGCGGSGAPRRHYSTNKEVLQRLAPKHRIAAIILKWRKLNTALSSSLQNLLRACRSNGRIHASFTTFTGTGRVQSVHPNVQNVQKDALIDSLSVRSLFVAPPGFVLVSADYSQLELRVLAGLSKDEGLCKLFRNGGDFFQTVTDRWNANTSIDVPLDRQKVKQLCYAIIYGMGAITLGERIGTTKQNAQHLIESFFKEFPKVRSWMDATLESCRRDACAVTILGRRRPLKCGESVVQSDRARAERQAINSTIQGSASEIFKSALLKLEKNLKDLDARIVMQVHDEVIVELNEACFSTAVERIESAMLNALPEFPVPLSVKISSGTNWGSLLPLNS
uniref:DNA-directed DNA polymerase n=1 Tax=Ascaris suum TaxID=6253 RepID=F1KT71_ASCSU